MREANVNECFQCPYKIHISILMRFMLVSIKRASDARLQQFLDEFLFVFGILSIYQLDALLIMQTGLISGNSCLSASVSEFNLPFCFCCFFFVFVRRKIVLNHSALKYIFKRILLPFWICDCRGFLWFFFLLFWNSKNFFSQINW